MIWFKKNVFAIPFKVRGRFGRLDRVMRVGRGKQGGGQATKAGGGGGRWKGK